MAELKPCDCEKSDVRIYFGEYHLSGQINKYWVVCCGCGKETSTFYDTVKQAIEAWNKRS